MKKILKLLSMVVFLQSIEDSTASVVPSEDTPEFTTRGLPNSQELSVCYANSVMQCWHRAIPFTKFLKHYQERRIALGLGASPLATPLISLFDQMSLSDKSPVGKKKAQEARKKIHKAVAPFIQIQVERERKDMSEILDPTTTKKQEETFPASSSSSTSAQNHNGSETGLAAAIPVTLRYEILNSFVAELPEFKDADHKISRSFELKVNSCLEYGTPLHELIFPLLPDVHLDGTDMSKLSRLSELFWECESLLFGRIHHIRNKCMARECKAAEIDVVEPSTHPEYFVGKLDSPKFTCETCGEKTGKNGVSTPRVYPQISFWNIASIIHPQATTARYFENPQIAHDILCCNEQSQEEFKYMIASTAYFGTETGGHVVAVLRKAPGVFEVVDDANPQRLIFKNTDTWDELWKMMEIVVAPKLEMQFVGFSEAIFDRTTELTTPPRTQKKA